jgi:hypothetical protein
MMPGSASRLHLALIEASHFAGSSPAHARL